MSISEGCDWVDGAFRGDTWHTGGVEEVLDAFLHTDATRVQNSLTHRFMHVACTPSDAGDLPRTHTLVTRRAG